MADLKISQLNSLAGGSLANNDVLAVVDTSASETKKITSKDLVQYGYGLIDASTLDGDIIEAGTTSARGTIQLTDSTSSTSLTTAATPNSVKAAYDLANSAMPKAGGTFTGNISFEGTADDFETTFAITDPTADRTITFKDESGTVAYLSDISGISGFLALTGGTMTGQILGDNSTSASTPGYAFDGDPNTGLLRTGADELALVTGGTARLTADASGNINIPGNLSVQGTTTTIDSTTLVVKDKNIEMGAVTSPTDVTADGGGITLKGTTDKTINWIDSTDAWTFSEHVDLASTKEIRIAGTKVLDATSLGSGVVSSSLTSVGTIATGTWSATTIAVNKGGTGQTSYTDGQLLIGNSTGNTLAKSTLTAGSGISITNGSGSITIAATASGDVTLNGVQTLTNKTLTDPAIIGTILEDVYTISDGAAFEIDPGNGSIQLITLGANRTPKATNFAAGEAVTLMVDDGSAYTLTWSDSTFGGSGVVWKTGGGNAPTLNTTGYTVIVLWKVGTQVYGARVGDA
jgi:hypothetical protein